MHRWLICVLFTEMVGLLILAYTRQDLYLNRFNLCRLSPFHKPNPANMQEEAAHHHPDNTMTTCIYRANDTVIILHSVNILR
jgi:hypothetical protein